MGEALLPPLPPPPSFITRKGTCAPAEVNFLQWLQMCLSSLSLFTTPSSLCWKFLPSVLLDVEICGCNQTERWEYPGQKSEGEDVSLLSLLLCCLQIKISNLNLNCAFKGINPLVPSCCAGACQALCGHRPQCT